MQPSAMLRTGVVVQARMGSSRFPGKVLADLNGAPVLDWVVRRCAMARRVTEVVVATTSLPEDDVIEEFCVSRGLACFRGSVEDVLDRFRGAAERLGLDVVVRVTSDCPLVDPALIDDLLEALQARDADYVTNSMPMRLPHGFEASAMTRSALESAASEATRAADREHVTLYLRDHPERFKLHALQYEADAYDLRVTVDHPVDLEVVRFVVRELGDRPAYGSVYEVVRILRAHPEVAALNAMHPPGEGLARSLAAERGRS
jgi:spore coat polysaccharide biosynthesis protein SpsF